MKPLRLLFLPFFILSIPVFYGQTDWAPLGAQWHYCQGTGLGAPPCGGFYYLESTSDTVIDGQLCRKLSGYQKDWRNQVTPLPDRFTFAQNDSVFVYQPARGGFLLTYDFTAQTGDTLEFPAPELAPWDPSDTTFRVVVDSIVARPAGQDTLRFFYVTSLPDENWVFYGGWYAEKIGGRMLQTPFPAITIPEIDGFIRCYSDATASIQFGSDPCNYTQSGWFGQDPVWYYGYYTFFYQGYETMQLDGDTLIQSIPCRIFRRTLKWNPGSGIVTQILPPRYAYDVSDRVMVWRDTGFYALYDFNLQPGDSLSFPVPDCPDPYWYRVDSTGVMTVSGQPLRFQRVSLLSPWGGGIEQEVIFLERVGMGLYISGMSGDTLGEGYFFIDEYVSCFTDGPSRQFRCYADQDIPLFKVGPLPCDFITAVPAVPEPLGLSVHPNPAKEWLTVSVDRPGAGVRYALTDALGRVLMTGDLTEPENRMSIARLPSGIYTLTVSAKDANIVRRIIIE